MAFGSAPRGIPRILQWLLAGLMMLIGLAVGGLGFKLATVGGSSYFLIMGVAMVIAAILIFLNRTSGILLYGIAFIASLFWAVSDAGWDFWPLFSPACLPLPCWRSCAPSSGPSCVRQTTLHRTKPRFWRRGAARGGHAGQPRLDV